MASKLICTAVRIALDLIAGSATSTISEHIFSKSWDSVFQGKEDEVSINEVLVAKSIRVFFQLAFTVFTALEMRALYVSDETDDPTGGMVFIWATGQLPKFWTRVNDLALQIRSRFFVGVNKPVIEKNND